MRNLTSAVLMSALIFTGCSSTPSADSELELAKKSPHLAAIPSDTPYAFASLEPMPLGEMVDKTFAKLGPQMDKIGADLIQTFSYPEASVSEKLIAAYFKEFQGNWSAAGLESKGFSMSPRAAVYGISWLPAFRYEVKDPVAFKAMVARIEKEAGVTATESKIGEYAYRSYIADDIVIALAFQGNEVIFGVTPAETAELYLPYLVGEKKPATNVLKTRRLEELVSKYGFKPYFVGFVDIERIVQMVIAPQPGLNEDIAAKLDPNRVLDLSPVCQTEMRGIVANYPRIVAGYDEWSAEAFSMRAGLEMTNGLGTQLATTQTAIPAAGSAYAKDAVGSVGMGVDIAALLSIMSERANAIANTPYQCDKLAEANQAAQQFGAVTMMIPPVLTEIKGVNFIVKDFNAPVLNHNAPQAPDGSLNGEPSTDVTASLVWKTSDALNMLNTFKMYIPELASVTAQTDGLAVQLPPMQALEMPSTTLFLAMSPTTLSVSTGQTAPDDATELAKSADVATPWMSLRYNPELLMNALGAANTPELQGFSDLFLGPVTIDVQPTEAGLFFTYRQNFSK